MFDFFKKDLAVETELKAKNRELVKISNGLNKDLERLQQKHDSLEKDFESEKRILESELKMRINEATLELKAKNQKLETEKSIALAEVDILRKAFENLGFDVKDMKEILGKLVDGIISKNKINVIK
jgi:hypothetical protein